MVVIGRKFSFSSCAMADYLTKTDPEMQIAKYLNKYWQRVRLRNIVKALSGSMAISAMSNMVENISTSGTISASNQLTLSTVESAVGSKFGQKFQGLTMIMHPSQYYYCSKTGVITMVYDPLYGRLMPKIFDMDIIVDDACGTSTNATYTSFILGNNALVCAEAKESIPFAIVADTGTREYLVSKKRYIAQPLGISFTGTPAGTSPTETELATSGNWTLSFDSEAYVPIIKFISNT
jgi:hypothetical protein